MRTEIGRVAALCSSDHSLQSHLSWGAHCACSKEEVSEPEEAIPAMRNDEGRGIMGNSEEQEKMLPSDHVQQATELPVSMTLEVHVHEEQSD